MNARELYRPAQHIRIVTAAALFDGHDAAINIIRRILQSQGVEVIHLGHNRSVDEVVDAVVEEDAQGVAISSYQGGHLEYFEYLATTLAERGHGHVRIVGGGGGVIVPEEIAQLAGHGVRIFSPDDGQRLGLAAMVNEVVEACDVDLWQDAPVTPEQVLAGDRAAVARALTGAEVGVLDEAWVAGSRDQGGRRVPVLGVTGTGGSGKSSLVDELVRRFRQDQSDRLRLAVVAVDPTRSRSGGALLGDRIRMSSLSGASVFFRSVATRGAAQLPESLPLMVEILKASGVDLIVLETPGIGQGDSSVVDLADVSLYVMTPEFGASSQLEKIDMLDRADVVAINKFDRRGAADALRDVGRQLVRSREAFGSTPADMPVFGTSASTFNDDGVTALYQALLPLLAEQGLAIGDGTLAPVATRASTRMASVVPAARVRYLSEIADTVRAHHAHTAEQADAARRVQRLRLVAGDLAEAGSDASAVEALRVAAEASLDAATRDALAQWPATVESYRGAERVVRVRDREIRTTLARTTLSGSEIRRVSVPTFADDGDVVSFLGRENLPGHFPFTAGVFEFKREAEDPTRMFAGEGDPFRTNRRFRLLSEGNAATRLSTAFDSVTLYGRDPDPRPDIYGKVGTSGVSVATIDDMRELFDGFDLASPTTSVSMTINGPAPTMLAFFLNVAVDQQLDAFAAREGRPASADEAARVRADTLSAVRGTVQADILKEDQGQNTCIFGIEFSLRMMADIEEWFIENAVRNFYSVSISGYHIAEAGANPISQLAFTLANGFTYVESYLARGMAVDDFAPNLSFFFSNGMDAEYSVIGRVARRVWAIALRDRYGAGERAQKLKYHIQTSGRSLHASEMSFNDIRTTLQALIALYDNANSLHTNAYDEAVTTPSEESVRRAMAIQLIINREWGLSQNENPLQGSYVIDELTDLVEAAVLAEFDRLTERGGVLGAMETGYQRGRIQDESMLYEQRKHDGSLPIVGVNTFRGPSDVPPQRVPLARATEAERASQLERVRAFRAKHADAAGPALETLKRAVLDGENVFAVLMDAARVCSLGQITDAFFEVGGEYRRNV